MVEYNEVLEKRYILMVVIKEVVFVKWRCVEGIRRKCPAMVLARTVASVHILFSRCRFYSDKPLGERAFQLDIGRR